jgi:hypothetical protein
VWYNSLDVGVSNKKSFCLATWKKPFGVESARSDGNVGLGNGLLGKKAVEMLARFSELDANNRG